MYLEPWQIFLGGCVIGTLISLITLSVLIVNFIGKIGLKGIQIQHHQASAPPDTSDETDLVAKLSYILLTRGFLSDSDIEFMGDHISYDEWKKLLEQEIDEMESSDKDED